MESVYISILNKKILFSGLLKGPCIPIYGFGALLILNISGYCYNNIDVFFYSLISCTCLEYLTHYFLLKRTQILKYGIILKYHITILQEFVCFIVLCGAF